MLSSIDKPTSLLTLFTAFVICICAANLQAAATAHESVARAVYSSPLLPNLFQQLEIGDGEQPIKKATLSAEQQLRKQALHRCLSIYYTKQVDADVLRPWSIMHGLIAYGQDTKIITRGRRVNAVEYLCGNGIGDDRRILFVNNGKLQARVGRGVQGHEGQLLAMLAQCHVSADHPIHVDGFKFTVRDLIRFEQAGCQSNTELTFRLIGLSHYLKSNATWKNKLGETWSISRMIEEELQQPVNDGACGGTHRLMSLSYAVANRRLENKPIDGQWFRAIKFISDYQKYALQFQRENGEFSTEFFKSRKFDNDAKKRLYATGHILEWLVYSLPDDELQSEPVTRSVDFIVALLMSAPGYRLSPGVQEVGATDVGPRGHALHALAMYEARVFGKSDHNAVAKNPGRLTELQSKIDKNANEFRRANSVNYGNVSYSADGRDAGAKQNRNQFPGMRARRGLFGRSP